MKVRACDLALPIPEMEYRERQTRLGETLNKLGLDGIILFGPSVFYFSGYNHRLGDTVYLQTIDGDHILFSGIEEKCIKWLEERTLYCDKIIPYSNLGKSPFGEELKKFKRLKFGLAGGSYIQHYILQIINKSVGSTQDCSELIRNMRKVKNSREIELLKAAYYGISNTLNIGIKASDLGLSIGDLEGRMAQNLYTHGVECISESFSVDSGFNVGVLTLNEKNREIIEGDSITLDVGCTFYGYKAEASRTILVGENISQQNIEPIKVLNDSIDAAFQIMGPKISFGKICKTVWKILHKRYNPNKFYGILHSTGIEFIEPPCCKLSDQLEETIQEDMIVSLEVYVFNEFKNKVLKIVDVFLITEYGAEKLVRGVLSDPLQQIYHQNYKEE